MNGVEIRLARLFENGKAVIVAVDHGLFDGPIEGLVKPDEIATKIGPEIDGVLMSPGMLRHFGAHVFGKRGGPAAIVRINWSTTYCFSWKYHLAETVGAFTPEDAVELGADVVLISLSLVAGSEERDARNVKVFADLAQRAHRLGVPVIGEYFPADYKSRSPEELAEEIAIGCRILFELGADAIKTFHTVSFQRTVDGCPSPILTLGGEKYASEQDALKAAERQIADGASGVVFGRNVVQARNPLAFQRALVDIVRNGVGAETAAERYGVDS